MACIVRRKPAGSREQLRGEVIRLPFISGNFLTVSLRQTSEKLKADGLGATEIARKLGIGRASVYRALGGDA